MNFFQKIFSFFHKKTKPVEPTNNIDKTKLYSNNNLIDIVVSLRHDFTIDLLVYMDDQPRAPLSENEYAYASIEFIDSCFSKNMKNKIIEIINEQVKDNNNSQLINKLNALSSFTTQHNIGEKFIKPSQVFKIPHNE